MRYAKMLGLMALVAAAMMVVAGGATATTLTSPAGTKLGVGTKIKAQSEGAITFDNPHEIGKVACQQSTIEAEVTNAGGSGATVVAPVSNLTFSECGHTLTILKKGSLEFHGTEGGNGTLTWTGAEITWLLHTTFFGTIHCILTTNETDVGTVTGSATTKATATWDIGQSALGWSGTDSLCEKEDEGGEKTGYSLTGNYQFTTPDSLEVDYDAFPGTTVTSPKGTKLGTGTEIKAESEGAVEFAGTITFSCQKSTMEGKISNAGGEGATVSAELSKQTFTECGNHTVEVKKPGSLEIHSLENSNGTLTSTGAEITVLTHGIFLGTRHCIYTTSKTDLGTLTGSTTTGATATFDVGPVTTGQSATDANCGSNAEWGGSYKVTTPDSLYVD